MGCGAVGGARELRGEHSSDAAMYEFRTGGREGEWEDR